MLSEKLKFNSCDLIKANGNITQTNIQLCSTSTPIQWRNEQGDRTKISFGWISQTCNNVWVNGEGVVGWVDLAFFIILLAERQSAAIDTHSINVCVASHSGVRQLQVLERPRNERGDDLKKEVQQHNEMKENSQAIIPYTFVKC